MKKLYHRVRREREAKRKENEVIAKRGGPFGSAPAPTSARSALSTSRTEGGDSVDSMILSSTRITPKQAKEAADALEDKSMDPFACVTSHHLSLLLAVVRRAAVLSPTWLVRPTTMDGFRMASTDGVRLDLPEFVLAVSLVGMYTFASDADAHVGYAEAETGATLTRN